MKMAKLISFRGLFNKARLLAFPQAALTALLGMICLLLCLQASAQGPTQETWAPTDPQGLWSDGNNWNPSTKPGGPNGNFNVVIPHVNGQPLVTMDVSASIVNLEIDAAAGLDITSDSQLTITGATIVNNGTLEIDVNGGGAAGKLNISNTVTLSGTGQLFMESNMASISGGGTLINQQTINGFGTISVALQNEGPNGQILGGGSLSQPLIFTGAVTNSGLIGNDGFTVFVLLNNTVQNAGGTILAGAGAALLNGCTVIGGTVSGASAVPVALAAGGAIKLRPSSATATQTPPALSSSAPTGAPTLNGVTIVGQYTVESDATHTNGTILVGNITNNGEILVISGPGEPASVLFVPGAVSLSGTGQLAINGANASITGPGTLTNVSPHVIAGGEGSITVNDFINQSTVNGSITIAVQNLNNTNGVISATAPVTINGGSVQNGQIAANSSVSLGGGVVLSGVDFTGGAGGLVIAVNAILDGLVAPNTIQVVIEINDNDVLVLEGGVIILSPGEVLLDSSQFTASLVIEQSVAINGTGQINSSTSPNNKVSGAVGKKNALTINVPSLNLQGTVGDGTFPITIGPHTTVTNGGYPLIFNVGNNSFKNLGTLVEGDSTIQIIGDFANYNPATHTLAGGNYMLNGVLEFSNADIFINAANITLLGNGQIQNQNGGNGLLHFNGNKGTFALAGGQNFETDGTFLNTGALNIGPGCTFRIGGTSTNYNQTAGTTTVDGTLAVPAGGIVDITGGTLQASGNFTGDVSVGNAAGGVSATLIVGDSKKSSALVSMSNTYTQLATGVMDVQVGGTNAGTQYSQLNVTDTVKLAGTLNIVDINKFKPLVGQTFSILDAPSGIAGSFSTVNGTSINSTEHYVVNENSRVVELAVESGK